MIECVPIPTGYLLRDYERYAGLGVDVARLRRIGTTASRALGARTVWHLSSTSKGGGVAEMLPRLLALQRQAEIRTEWAIIHPEEPLFFPLTKHLHNLIHGLGPVNLGEAERKLFQAVSRQLADELKGYVKAHDVLVVHDPQPLGAGALLAAEMDITTVWRCHIGLDRQTVATRAAWEFLAPWLQPYDHFVFSLPQYVPASLKGRTTVMHPAIDPLSHKNRELSVHKLTGILASAGLLVPTQPMLTDGFAKTALRLQPDGKYQCAALPEDLGLLFRPVVLQVSRWDQLKGFLPVLRAFALLKSMPTPETYSPRDKQRLELLRLVLAGPDPEGVQDDPEAQELLDQLATAWRAMPVRLQADIAILKLPLTSRKENALMVNALQRCASVVVQNSLEEGFGLTVTEAMWKAKPILGSSAAGICAQVRDGIEGRLVDDPENEGAIATVLADMLRDPKARENWGFNARYRATEEFHILRDVVAWLQLYQAIVRPL